MNIKEVKKLCTEKLQGICSSCTIEEMKHIVDTEDMNAASHEYVLCHVKDEVKALCSLWGNISDSEPQEQALRLPILCISIKNNSVKLLNRIIVEELGDNPTEELRETKKYKKPTNIIKFLEKANTYLDGGSNDIHDERVKDFILNKGIKIVIIDE